MTTRTQLKAGALGWNHNEALQVRTALKAGGTTYQHNETLQVRTRRTGGAANNIVWMRRQPLTTSRKEDRLELLVVRAGLRAGRSIRRRARR